MWGILICVFLYIFLCTLSQYFGLIYSILELKSTHNALNYVLQLFVADEAQKKRLNREPGLEAKRNQNC